MKFLIKATKVILLSVAVLSIFSGCASSTDQQAEDGRVSTIPWNRPQRWEGSGQLGGMMQQ